MSAFQNAMINRSLGDIKNVRRSSSSLSTTANNRY